MTSCYIVDAGLIGYAGAWELQKRLVAARKSGAVEDVLLRARLQAWAQRARESWR